MKIEITREWCLRMAQLEADAEIGAGLISIDPVFDGEAQWRRSYRSGSNLDQWSAEHPERLAMPTPAASVSDEANIAFGRFVRLLRRSRGLTRLITGGIHADQSGT